MLNLLEKTPREIVGGWIALPCNLSWAFSVENLTTILLNMFYLLQIKHGNVLFRHNPGTKGLYTKERYHGYISIINYNNLGLRTVTTHSDSEEVFETNGESLMTLDLGGRLEDPIFMCFLQIMPFATKLPFGWCHRADHWTWNLLRVVDEIRSAALSCFQLLISWPKWPLCSQNNLLLAGETHPKIEDKHVGGMYITYIYNNLCTCIIVCTYEYICIYILTYVVHLVYFGI